MIHVCLSLSVWVCLSKTNLSRARTPLSSEPKLKDISSLSQLWYRWSLWNTLCCLLLPATQCTLSGTWGGTRWRRTSPYSCRSDSARSKSQTRPAQSSSRCEHVHNLLYDLFIVFCTELFLLKYILCIFVYISSIPAVFGSDRSSWNANVRPSVCSCQTCLELTIFIIWVKILHDDFMMTSGWLQDNFRMTSESTQRSIRLCHTVGA